MRTRHETSELPVHGPCTSRLGCGQGATVRVLWPGNTTLMCVGCALRASNTVSSMGFTLKLEPLTPAPQPPCKGCDSPIERCGPALWLQQKKCCPDCTHGMYGARDDD